MSTIKTYISNLTNKLCEIYPKEEAGSIAKFYVCEVIKISNTELICCQHENLDENKLQKLKNSENRLIEGEPVQYVTGQAYFYGLKFFVDKNVLIPRQETEILVQNVIQTYKQRTGLRILDIGTGSGCIAICLKKNMPQHTVFAIDISEKAIHVCKRNAEINKVDVVVVKSDIFADKVFPDAESFDIIVSNPPYVLESEKAMMHKNVTGYEPASALYVSDNNPLIYYKAILDFAKQYLNIGGEVIVEINEKYPEEIIELNKQKGFSENEIMYDLNKKPRFIKSKK
ncbi:MAG TPA: peptide chain release factor N(5)-glutamine methyltransferase [Bacteroidales bacterium]|nr:peptide chain release factor N(5)-glutamine methyltransferase [Bacteroidales bacterium]